jgi:anti-sigma factor RsiW
MHCSEFRDNHCAFVDDTLAGVELVRMQRHILDCPACAKQDAKIRRSLMVIRSMPQIEPSSDFGSRLEMRLRECRGEPESVACANFKMVATVGAVASMVMLGYVAASFHRTGTPRDLVLPPVVAIAEPPQQQPTIVSSSPPAIIASVAAGMPLWPAAMFAEQASLQLTTYRESH